MAKMLTRVSVLQSLMAVLFLCVYVNVAAQNSPNGNENWISVLRRELFERRKYDKHVRPVPHHGNVTEIYMQFSLSSFRFDEIKSTFHTNGWLTIMWTDEMLTWNPDSFGGLQNIKLPSDQIWTPDIIPHNSLSGFQTMSASHLVLLKDGVVMYVPPLALATHCEVDVTLWPFDQQTCELRFGAWSHDSNDVTLGILANETQVDLKHFAPESSPWVVMETKAEVNSLQFDCCSPPYQDAMFTLKIKRNSPFDAKMALSPAIVVWALVLVTFWMNPLCPERIHVGCMAILLVTLLLIYFRMTLPASGNHIPIVVIFHVTLLALSGLGVLVTLVNSNLIRRNQPTPDYLTCLLHGKAGSILCAPSHSSLDSERVLKASEEGHSETESCAANKGLSPSLGRLSPAGLRGPRPGTSGWVAVASLIDRLAFIAYIVVMTVIGLRYLLL